MRGLSKFCLPFDKATPLVHFPKALKRPRNNAGPAGIYMFFFGKKGVRINYKLKKILEGQEYAPRLEPTALIHLADLCSLSTLEGGVLKRLTACPLGAGKKVRAHLGGRCVKSTCNIFR